MRTRLRYLAVLLASVLAIAVGAYPSLLTLGALLGIGTGLAALAGLIAPRILETHRGLRWFTLGGGVAVTLEILTLAVWIALTPRRTVHLTVPSEAPRLVRIVYGVRDGVPSARWRWDRYFAVDSATVSIIRTRLDPDNGWFNERQAHAAVAQTEAGVPVRVRWTAGGYADAGRCRIAYDQFYVGHGSATPSDPSHLLQGGWLDSLSQWGVDCRDGQLVRSSTGVHMRRTSAPCYFNERGGITCGVSRSAS
jgi:hypothetical protein